MIEILLDNNALQYISDSDKYETYIERIGFHVKQNNIRLHYNHTAFLERIQGLNKKYFDSLMLHLRKANIICNNTLVLPIDYHLMQCINPFTDDELRAIDYFWRSKLNRLCGCNKYEDVDEEIKYVRQKRNEVRDSLFENEIEMAEIIRSIRPKETDINVYYANSSSLKDILKFKDMIYRTIVKKYGLQEKLRYMPGLKANIRLKSVFYFIDVYTYYRYQLFIGNIKPQKGDLDDISQVFYLNICDYIMTRDKIFNNLLDNCGNTNLNCRGLKPEKFYGIIMSDRLILTKRAPDMVSSIDI